MKRFLREPEVLKRIGVSDVTLWRWQRKGLFPNRRRLGPNAVGWLEEEVDEWCNMRSPAQQERAHV
jgi:prophage regulatory protein